MSKKRKAPRKPARKTTTRRAGAARPSRLNLKPIRSQIDRRIKQLERESRAREVEAAPDPRIEQLQQARELLQKICHPTMTI